jgi:anti-anti-sigma factor
MDEKDVKFTEMQQTPLLMVAVQRQLVRGEESEFVNEIAAQLHSRSVELDLSRVEQIDAAGIAALVSLYAQAHDLRRSLTIVAVSRHVKEILTLVGLEGVLLSHIVSAAPQSGPHLETVAA